MNKRLIRTLLYSYRFPRDILYCYFHLQHWDPTWRLLGCPLLHKHRAARFVIGRNWTACSDARHNSLGVFQRVTVKCFGGGNLAIGDDVGMSGCSIACSHSITIGNNVLIGSGAMIMDSDAHPIQVQEREDGTKTKQAPVVIEDGVFIGARAMVLKGVRIGYGSVIGAGSIVTKDVPAKTMAAGNPARSLRSLDS